MKTYSAKFGEIAGDWYLVDAEGRTLGRLAAAIASHLRGKHKPQYTPHVDTGDYIVIVNAEKVRVTGEKERDKYYYRHTGYPGGLRKTSLGEMRTRHPDRIIRNAVRGMLPRTPLGYAMLSKLHVYAGAEHPHQAQQPSVLEL